MRALILSDIHANLEALQAVLAATAGQYDELWNLGDLVGYGASPNEVIELMRPLENIVVRGNHDRVCCGLTSAAGFNPVARAAAQWTGMNLKFENLAWLRAMPQGPVSSTEVSATCSHGSPLDEDKYILNMRDAWSPLQQMTTQLTFFGHTHIQGGFAQTDHQWHELRPTIGRPRNATDERRSHAESWTIQLTPGTRHLINPGSVGQPRDFDWRAAYAILDIAESTEGSAAPGTLTFHRVPYDLVSSQGRILMAGLPERLAIRLREGR
jgi:predicted phosphodiesterase